MQIKTMTAIWVICLVLTACNNNTLTIAPTNASMETGETITAAPVSAASPALSVSNTRAVELGEYTTVYEEGDFRIQEAFLFEGWNWDNFLMPQNRIQNTVPDLGFVGGGCDTTAEFQVKSRCTETVTITTTSGQERRFDLICDHMLGGHCVLTRNSNFLWEGELNGGTWLPIESSKQIGDEIAFTYHSPIWDDKAASFWLLDSIMLTEGNTIVDVVETTGYTAVFAPNELQNKLTYFAETDKGTFLVFDGKEVGERYINVFNQYCCWDGPPIQVHCDGKMVDFFARKEDGWYHVQAGTFKP